MKKVLAIMGSHRKGKNSDFLLDTFLKGLSENSDVEIKKVYIKDLKFGDCIGCGYCEKHGVCFQKDELTPIYDDFNDSDGIVFATPLYFGGPSTLTKKLIDRCQIYWSSKYVLNKSSIDRDKKRHGALIVAAGGPEYKDKFIAFDAIFGILFRALNTDKKCDILMSNSDKSPAQEREDLIEQAYNCGKNFFEGF